MRQEDLARLIDISDPRVHLAAERTLLAWIRTGLAMMGFGFVVARFGLFLRELAAVGQHMPVQRSGLSLWLGTLLVVLGVTANVSAALRHRQFTKGLKQGEVLTGSSLGLVFAIALAVVGLGMVAYLFKVG